jgi:hypothetical protein
VNLFAVPPTNVHLPENLDYEVTLIVFVLRWLTDTLPIDQQTPTYRRRQIEMKRSLEIFRTRGLGG